MSDLPELILALDQGTTSSRAIVFDKQLQIHAIGQNPFNQYYPNPGWVEHDALEILSSQLAAVSEALIIGNIEASRIRGIGITNQRETTIIWNKETGVPIAPAIVWQCRRTSEMVGDLTSDPEVFERIRKTTGLVPDAYFSASKIKWLLDTVPGAREQAQQGQLLFGTVDSWLVWQLTSGATHATDYTNASRTMLFDIHKGCWDEWLLDLFDVPAQMLPEVRPSAAFYGTTSHPSVPNGIPICGVAGDQQAALFGQGCFKPGQAKNTYGTGSFLLVHTGNTAPLSQNQLITTIAASAPAAPLDIAGFSGREQGGVAETSGTAGASSPSLEYVLEGSVFVSGALIQWLRDDVGMLSSAAESQVLAESVEDTAGVRIVPAFTGLGAPYWDMEARGAILGLTRSATRAHLVRAALEAMAFQLNDLVEAVRADTGLSLEYLKVDGGASENDFLLQFQSDILDAEIRRPQSVESTALGAAFLAGLTLGVWKGLDELLELTESTECTIFSPHMGEEERKSHVSGWKTAVARVLS